MVRENFFKGEIIYLGWEECVGIEKSKSFLCRSNCLCDDLRKRGCRV